MSELSKEAISKHNLSIARYQWENLTFLIAEDVDINYQILEKALKKTNVKLLWAKNGKEAVELYESEENFSIILIDIQMPEMDGFEASKIIREKNKDIPIIAYTGYNYEGVTEKIILAGANECLLKPFAQKKLLNTIRKYLFIS